MTKIGYSGRQVPPQLALEHTCAAVWTAGMVPAMLALTASVILLPLRELRAQSPERGVMGDSAPASPAARSEAARLEVAPGRELARAAALAPARTVTEAIGRAVQLYRETGAAAPVTVGPVTVFPFGRAVPTLVCTALRACTIELEAGEIITDSIALADPVRWDKLVSRAGPGGTVPLVIVKPKDCDLTTNVVIPTDRRVYDITLDSPPCKADTTNPPGLTVRQLRFYYPDDSVRRPAAPARVSEAGAADTVTLRLVTVNRDYKLPRKPKFPWKPAEIFDDGAHVYIRVPESARHEAAPVLYALEDDGTRTLVNYTVRDDLYVTDRTFRRGLLVLGGGKHEQTLEIENRAWGKPRLPVGER